MAHVSQQLVERLDGHKSRLSEPARVVQSLRDQGVSAVAVTVVDNAGIARAKSVPVNALERAAFWGLGLSPVFGVALVNDAFTATSALGGPAGDLRLIPDLGAARVLGSDPEWGWAPADQLTQERQPFGSCQRTFLRRMVAHAGDHGLSLKLGCELEWFIGREVEGVVIPAHSGPGYGFAALSQLSEYAGDLIAAFAASGIEISQLHPEYGPGQFEVSLPPADPVAAADLGVIARQLIRSISAQHGWRASFSPVVVPDQVGNGGHVHFSVWRDGRNLLAGGDGPHGLTEDGASFIAGVLSELPALMAIGAPSVASYLRVRPSRWAGAYACWGHENREAALRFISGMNGGEQTAANCEVKCFDQSANPYLALGAVIAAGLSGLDRRLRLPPQVLEDPASLIDEEPGARGVERLPSTLERAIASLERSGVIGAAMGEVLFDAVLAVRRAEWETFGSEAPERVAEVHRWRY